MTLAPLLNAPAVIQLHALAAMCALVLGSVQFVAPKGTMSHRIFGWAWVLLMASVAISSFWITIVVGPGQYSPIHVLSVIALVALVRAVWAARRGAVRTHRFRMILIFGGALLITGLFTLLPNRIMNIVLFGS